MPFAWFKALRLDNGDRFAADQLARYGYLRNDSPTNKNNLPVGFVIDGNSGQLGMTCAACHTGQIVAQSARPARRMRSSAIDLVDVPGLAVRVRIPCRPGARPDLFHAGIVRSRHGKEFIDVLGVVGQ